jgi:hypothetical protein
MEVSPQALRNRQTYVHPSEENEKRRKIKLYLALLNSTIFPLDYYISIFSISTLEIPKRFYFSPY